jgi:hypothetical protein
MISAPLRTPQLKNVTSVKTHAHLALLEWEEALPSIAPIIAPIAAQPSGSPIRKSKTAMDRCYEGGTAVLFAATIAALAASLCRF